MPDDVAAPPKTSVPVWDSKPPTLGVGTEYTIFSTDSEDDATARRWSAQLRRSDTPHDVIILRNTVLTDWLADGVGHFEELATDKYVGWRVAAAGDELGVLGVLAAARHVGLIDAEITVFAETTRRRLVFCAHCKATTLSAEPTGGVLTCRGCARTLTVRPHVSRDTGTYLGVSEPTSA
jgi:dimethylamine monooxygenase subunit C